MEAETTENGDREQMGVQVDPPISLVMLQNKALGGKCPTLGSCFQKSLEELMRAIYLTLLPSMTHCLGWGDEVGRRNTRGGLFQKTLALPAERTLALLLCEGERGN